MLYKYKSVEVLYSTSPEDAAVNMVLSKLAYTNPLIEAVKSGDITKVQRLLKEEVDLNNRDPFDWTALHYAASKGHYEMVILLLNAGADKDKPMLDGSTPLFMAVQNGHEAVVALLLEAGVEKNNRDWFGWTPLHHAAWCGNVNAVELLLNAGANKDIMSLDNVTPLIIANEADHEQIVKLLE